MKKIFFLATVTMMLTACGGNSGANATDSTQVSGQEATSENPGNDETGGNEDNADNSSSTQAKAEEPSFNVEDITLPKQLKGKVEIVKAKKSVGRFDYPQMEITFKLLETVDTKPLVSAGGQMWIIGVGQDQEGAVVSNLMPTYKEWRTNDREGNQFKAFLESDPGKTITLEFTGDNGEDKKIKVRDELEKVKKFGLDLKK